MQDDGQTFTIQAELIAWLISIRTMYACDVAYRLVIQVIIAMCQHRLLFYSETILDTFSHLLPQLLHVDWDNENTFQEFHISLACVVTDTLNLLYREFE